MRTIEHTTEVTLEVDKSALINEKYLAQTAISAMLKQAEADNKLVSKTYRNSFYNSIKADKYNTVNIGTIKCVDVTNPMKSKASLSLTFKIK